MKKSNLLALLASAIIFAFCLTAYAAHGFSDDSSPPNATTDQEIVMMVQNDALNMANIQGEELMIPTNLEVTTPSILSRTDVAIQINDQNMESPQNAAYLKPEVVLKTETVTNVTSIMTTETASGVTTTEVVLKTCTTAAVEMASYNTSADTEILSNMVNQASSG